MESMKVEINLNPNLAMYKYLNYKMYVEDN